jgi:uncharacterized protein YndB with AHSA1/START domain
MATVTCSTTIRAPLEEVFAYRLDLANLPRYNPDVTGMTSIKGPPGEGATYSGRVRLMPGLRLAMTLTILEVEAPRRIVLEIVSLMRAREVCTFEPAQGATVVRFETSVTPAGGPFAPLVDRWFVLPNARRQMTRELEKMKELLET